MSTEIGWDQQIFNEEAMFPAHGESTTGLVSIRILDYIRFINSKTFFKSERRNFLPGSTDSKIQADTLPVMVHMVGEGGREGCYPSRDTLVHARVRTVYR